jgi:glycosyltransferase involved in cell wall biosynthesis
MTQPSPLVSIVIPVHNGGEHLIDSVRSALDQDYPNLEVVVIDNASNDGAVDLLHRLEDPRLQVHRYDELIPAADNWTRAVQAGKGTYTKLLCADDLLEAGMRVQTRTDSPRTPNLRDGGGPSPVDP